MTYFPQIHFILNFTTFKIYKIFFTISLCCVKNHINQSLIYSYVIRMSLECHSYVIVRHSYVFLPWINLKSLKKFFSSYYKHILIFFSVDESYYCPTGFYQINFDAVLDKKWRKRLIIYKKWRKRLIIDIISHKFDHLC